MISLISRKDLGLLVLIIVVGTVVAIINPRFVSPINLANTANLIHVLTSRLRRTLGDLGTVSVVDDEVRLVLETEVAWDAATFGRLAERALTDQKPEALEAALALYGGPSLGAFDGPWVEAHRARLDDLHVALLEAAVEVATDPVERQRAEARLAQAFAD